MKPQNHLLHGFGHATLVLGYISGISWFLFNAERFFGGGKKDTFFIPIAMLLLFVLSATVVGTLVLGRPILMYIDGEKRAALRFFGYTIGWIFLLTVGAFANLALMAR